LLLLRLLALLSALVAAVALPAAPARAHNVKDPVCRMLVDSDTTKFKHKLGNKTFYFCSKQCQVSFARTPEKYEKLAAQLEKQDLHEYRVDFETSSPAVAGQPVAMTFAIRYAEDGKLVQEFERIHEKWLHLLMVSEDLSWFEHQHPVRGEDGLFRLTWTFPRPGRYRLYADFTPSDGDNQVKPLPLAVDGGPARAVPLKPDGKRARQVRDYRIDLQVRHEPLRMEKAAVLTYTIRDRRGRPVRNMQPFIGAMGHLVAISQDGKEVVHTHAVDGTVAPPMEAGAIHVTPAMATEKGPAFSFKLTLPTGGLYKTWAQFMHNNRVLTVPFTFQVEDLWGQPTSTAVTKKMKQQEGIQRATVVVDGGYSPASVAVKAGRPVQLTFVLKEAAGCGDVVYFPSLGLKRTLKTGQKTVVTFTPRQVGTVPFTCGMSMYRGQLVVTR
jgi:YHS domain-containing protein/plastocyanin